MLFMSKPEPEKEKPLRRHGVLSFLGCIISTAVFLAAFSGHEWFVVPPINYSNLTSTSAEGMRIYVEILRYSCDLSPTHLPKLYYECPVTFGIWRLCYREHCVYDVSNNYMLVNYLPYEDVRRPFDDVITPIQWLMCLALICLFVTIGMYLGFLAGATPLIGIGAVAAQGLAGILTLCAVITFGVSFRGPTATIPFGWTFWVGIIAFCMLLVNAIIFLIILLIILTKTGVLRMRVPAFLRRS